MASSRAGARSTRSVVDDALAEIARLPGRHLYFLDDHLFGNPRFARDLFRGMSGMGRVFQGAATVDSILRDDVVEEAAAAGLRSLFVGFETLSSSSLAGAGKRQNLGRSYRDVVRRLDSLGIMINGSFVFGLDGDDRDVFSRTVDWAVQSGITTATFHILTPYPGHGAVHGNGSAGPHRDAQLGPLRHAPRCLSPDAHVAGRTEARLRLGVRIVLPLERDLQGVVGARIGQAPAEALLLQRRMEEVRARVGPRHPDQAAVADAADPRSGARAGGQKSPQRHRGHRESSVFSVPQW